MLRDAVKRALPDAAPKPGAFRKGADDEKPAKAAEDDAAKDEATPEAPAAEAQDAKPAEGEDKA